jgi:aspartyl-tRNA(Asn)/glutamyl-tRNA(Gln) amidotransferase subunit A
VKDNIFVGGLRATWGSLLFEQHVAPRDDLPVAALRAAGAVVLGKTNTPELAMSGFTDNRVFGSTGNPWNPALSPGGSSGGAVAAVGAGVGPVALATDAGGSIRRPAAHAGVAGLKPGIGRVPRRHGFPPLSVDLQVIGPIARSVADLRAAFAATAAPGTAARPTPAGPLRLAAFGAVGDAPVDPAVSAAFGRALDVLRGLGHRVEEIAAP